MPYHSSYASYSLLSVSDIEHDLSRSLKVKSNGVIGLPIYHVIGLPIYRLPFGV